ncbi:hypothetical protein B296_00031676 [Ensete ventricosum]|uniref:Uncharacterized protein n=1 Tax=Ensete ventricosum TaxID=4639 RepID=A0A427AD17_ENSVE|nr:hypothetical protein B296_00031676 [Ensete ventricosum]
MRVCLHPLHARQHLHAWDVELRESDRRAQGTKRGKGKSFFTRERERERGRLRRGNLVIRWWQTA